MSLLLQSATTQDGSLVDVRCEGPLVTAVAPALAPRPGEEVHDRSGHLLLPAPAEPHAHSDEALTSHRAVNPTGDLAGAVTAIREVVRGLTHDDLVERATRAAPERLADGPRRSAATRTSARTRGSATCAPCTRFATTSPGWSRCRRPRAAAGRWTCTPTRPWTAGPDTESDEHADFPGTLSLSFETLMATLLDLEHLAAAVVEASRFDVTGPGRVARGSAC